MSLNIKISSPFHLKIFFLLVLNILMFTSILTYSFNLGYRMTAKYTPLIDASMEIKLQATTAHLYFEEILSGDKKQSIQNILNHIETSKWYANAMIHGGENYEGVYMPLTDTNLINTIRHTIVIIDDFIDMTHKRYHNIHSKIDADNDEKYDALFKELIQEADSVEASLQRIIKDELESYKLTYYVILIAWIFVVILGVVAFYRYEKEKLHSLLALKESNEELQKTKIDLLKTNEIVNKLANTDKLTQLYNRLKIDSIFDAEVQRALRYKETFSLILLDIDFFKKVNDTYGHDIGDYALIEISGILKNEMRRTDSVGRFGGEEFVIICPQTHQKNAALLAEKLRHSIKTFQFKTIGTQTCSFGVSEFLLSDTSKEEVIKRADKALYKAKENGRDKVVIY